MVRFAWVLACLSAATAPAAEAAIDTLKLISFQPGQQAGINRPAKSCHKTLKLVSVAVRRVR